MEFLVRMMSGRTISDAMRRQANEVRTYGEQVTEEEIAAYWEEATQYLARYAEPLEGVEAWPVTCLSCAKARPIQC